MEAMLFPGPGPLLRVLVVGILAYVALLFLLRVSGARTLSKMNAADFVVTVAIGSTLGSVLLDSGLSLAEGVLAFALLIGLQFVVTWSSVRFGPIRRLVTGEPRMLAYAGESLPAEMLKARVTEAEVDAALRAAGLRSIEDALAVVLETDGSISIVRPSR